MTTLAGAVPRMMRPGPGQNYPRSGFPLEGKGGPRRRPEPGAVAGLLHSTQGLHWLLWRAQGAHPLGTPTPEANSRSRSPLDFLPANRAQFFGQTLAEPDGQACSRRVHFLLLFWKCRGGEGMNQLLSTGKQLLRILSNPKPLKMVPAAPIFAKLLLVPKEFSYQCKV